jgi:Domain of unknown function (DUF6457)
VPGPDERRLIDGSRPPARRGDRYPVRSLESKEPPMGLALDEWIDQVRRALASSDPGIELGPEERDAILDLARLAAHRSERIAAPLTAFIVGAAMRDLPATTRTERILALNAALEGHG